MSRSPVTPLAAAALIAAALLLAACDESERSGDVEVKTPKLASDGRTLTMSEWRHAVSGICREATEQIGHASTTLTKQLTSEPASLSEADISRSAYEVSRPVIEDHLRQLADLRPPPALDQEYERYIQTLALELELSGRIAMLVGEDGAEEELLEADAGLAAAAEAANRFVHRRKLWGCAGGSVPEN